jgi:hypothetical protein
MSAIYGKFHNFNVNAGELADFSVSFSWSDNGTWVLTPQVGPGIGVSVSAYDTYTEPRN